ncbi:MAG: hypothetical protein QM753_10745 [Thermomicrobiales bacterium]
MSDPSPDITFAIGGFAGNPALEALREQAPDIFAQIGDYYDAVLSPTPDAENGLSLAERALIAQRVAERIPSPTLDSWYGALLAERGGITKAALDSPRLQAIQNRIRLVNEHPDFTTADDVQDLFDAGLTHGEVIALSQLIAFVHYQARLLAGLRAIGTPAPRGASR